MNNILKTNRFSNEEIFIKDLDIGTLFYSTKEHFKKDVFIKTEKEQFVSLKTGKLWKASNFKPVEIVKGKIEIIPNGD
jgi:hypothetical protein